MKKPKTAAGCRALPLPEYLYARLLALRPEKHSLQNRIFSFAPDAVTERFARARNKCGIHRHFRDLRPYNASVMLALGIPDKYAMKRMGHATTNMLKTVYQHTMEEKEKAAADKIEAYMSKLEG